jgi:transcriptional regulator with XRE-family HTH domain
VSDVNEPAADMTARRFAENLRAARERAGLSQQDLANRMGENGHPMPQQTINRIENGQRRVEISEALALARSVGGHIDSLVRPQHLLDEAWRLLDGAREVREARAAADRLESARARLEKHIARVTEAGHADALADEITIARQALTKETGRYGSHRR